MTTKKRQLKRLAARAIYALPVLSRRDPRRQVVRFREYCRKVDEFPAKAERAPENWYLPIRPAESFSLSPPLALDAHQATAFAAGANRHQGGTTLQLTEVFLASIRDAKIYSQDFLLLSSENKIFLESALSRPDYLEANGILDTVLLPAPRRLAGTYCLLANRSIRGYYHWLIDILPKLSLVERFHRLASVPLLLPANLSGFHLESLAQAGIPADRIARVTPGFWQADRVYFPELLGPTGIPSPHAVSWLRNSFLRPSGVEGGTPGTRRVYLTRRDASQRRVLNEPEITAYLAGKGFEIICPGDLSFAQQVELFQDVGIVVAPHGAGLTNMVFASPGATFIEFFGDNYINGCFWALANICRHRHAFLIGPSTWLDYHIPLSDLKMLLDRIGL